MVPADVVDYCDDKHDNDAYSDVRYGTRAHGAVPADAVHQAAMADAAVRADVVVAGRMQIPLITGINMRILVFS